MSAVVYLKVFGDNLITFISSKTKVAPLKRLTIPRLELSAAVLLTKLVAFCKKTLALTTIPCYMWTDSSIVYTWLNSDPARWKEFVHNRVSLILNTLPDAQWKHIPGISNPADCATRGLSARDLRSHALWWKGPPWLSQDSVDWPISSVETAQLAPALEEKVISVNPGAIVVAPWSLLNRYSSLTKLVRVTDTIVRAVQCFRKLSAPLSKPLSRAELDKAIGFWIRKVQVTHFAEELKLLTTEWELPRSNPLLPLTPFVDGNGFLRVGGRLKNSSLSSSAKHPYILPRNSILSSLIISDAHHQTLHGSTQDTLSYLRSKYWILGGRIPIRFFILKCTKCIRYRRTKAHQLMGQLPFPRVNSSRAFLHTGVDYAGPIQIKNWKGKNSRTYKAWIAVFVCFSSSATHLEIVSDYSSASFIAAFKRFTGRRGICATLFSDCGTNFKGADAELRQFFSQSSKELAEFATLIANDGTQWKFNPPAAPHFGGKWEACVKSMKYHLKRVIGDSLLTYEEMSTVLTQVEAILNSRPLCPLTNDPDDLDALTPGHFLVGHPLTLIPEPNLEMIKSNRLTRWQHLSRITQTFWTTWSKSCLQRFQAIYKWNRNGTAIKQGDLLIVVDELRSPAKWPLGRVTHTFPGEDGIVRVTSIHTQTGTIKRPIVKLIPVHHESNSTADSSTE